MNSEKDKMLAGELYSASDPQLVQERQKAKSILRKINSSSAEDTKEYIHELIPNSTSSLYIEPPFQCDYGYNIKCGENVYFNVNCVILDVTSVIIGSNVFFGPNVQIYTAAHPIDYSVRRKVEFGKAVIIGDDCWIGGGAIILPGVTIGNRCIIGAGAVVTKDVPDDSIAMGNPVKLSRSS